MVLSTLQTIALIVGIAYYLFIMRNSQRNQQHQLETRRAQLYMTLFNTINNQDIWRLWYEIREYQFADYDEYMEKYGPVENPEAFASWTSVAAFFQGLGVLVRKGLIEIGLVNDFLGSVITDSWEAMSPAILESRKINQIIIWDEFEFLYNEIKKASS